MLRQRIRLTKSISAILGNLGNSCNCQSLAQLQSVSCDISPIPAMSCDGGDVGDLLSGTIQPVSYAF
jgi:hypothetical protein